jgi:hypothetical protein
MPAVEVAPVVGRRRTQGADQHGHPAVEFLIDEAELVQPLQLIHRRAESSQHTRQQEREP